MTAATAKSNGQKPTVAALAKTKRLPVEFLRGLGLSDSLRGVIIPYYDAAGNCILERCRLTLTGKNETMQPKGVPVAAYGSWRIDKANNAGFRVVVEGESDCWTLWHYKLPALGVPGANNAKVIEREHVEAVETIYVVVEQKPDGEPDQGGEQFRKSVPARLAEIGFAGKMYELRMPDGMKDPSDLHVANSDTFLMRFQRAVAAATPFILNSGQHCHSNNCHSETAKAEPKTRTCRLIPYQPFPVHALPRPLDALTKQGADALGCDPAYVALPLIAVTMSAIGNTRTIRLKRTWEAPAVAWAGIVGDSGTLKSPAYLLAVRPLFRIQKRLRKEHKANLEKYQQAVQEYQTKKAAHKKNKEEPDPGDPPEQPVLVRVVTSDTTIEKLAEILEDNQRGTLLARDELAGWFGSFVRYKGKSGGTDLPNWLEMFRAGTIIVDRKTGERPSLFVDRAAVSVVVGIQPGVLARAFSQDFVEAGGAARLLLAMPPKVEKRWSESEVDAQVEEAYERLLTDLLTIPLYRDPNDATKEDRPFVLRLSGEARDAWIAFYNEWGGRQAASEGEMAAVLSKLEGYAARLTLLHHVVSCIGAVRNDMVPVEMESVVAGIALARWFADESYRIYAMLGESDAERETRRLIEFIQARGGRITVKELQRSNSRKYRTADDAKAVLDALVQAGVADWIDGPVPPRGGKQQRWLVLRPTTDDSDDRPFDNDQNPQQPPDDCSDHRNGTCEFAEENEQSSESSVVGRGIKRRATGKTTAREPEQPSEPIVGQGASETDRSGRNNPFDDLTPL